jgi:LacI family transcriptional regulator
MKHVTMQDIAQKAGVTKATVSMVINNDKRITEATRQKVLGIIKELNYYPNESARKLAKGKTDSIAFLAPRFGPPFISNILDAFENLAFRNEKFARGIQPYATRNQTAVLEELLRKVLYGREADAVVILTQEPSGAIVREYLENQVPMVLIENEIAGVHSVRIDNVQGAYQATDYLAKKGRKNIGLVVGAMGTDPAWGANRSAIERLEGYRKALKDNGLESDPNRVVTVIQYEYGEGATCAEQLLKKKNLDAVFCAAGDMVAMGLMEYMIKKGLRIPADIPIIGYDDMIAARMLNPSLTTVRQSFGEIASIAFEMAVDSIDGKIKKEKHVVLAPELILRESA